MLNRVGRGKKAGDDAAKDVRGDRVCDGGITGTETLERSRAGSQGGGECSSVRRCDALNGKALWLQTCVQNADETAGLIEDGRAGDGLGGRFEVDLAERERAAALRLAEHAKSVVVEQLTPDRTA